MKFLLGGMDRKFMQTNSSKYQKYIAPEWPSSKKLQNSFGCLDAAASCKHLFHGFQTNKPLEKDVFITHLPTPNFATYAENITKTETKTTKDELRLVKENLDKLLGTSRHGSSNTRGDKLLEEEAKNQDEAIAIPPQPCTFGSKARLPELNMVKDQKTSLRDLFQKAKMSEEKPQTKSNVAKTEKHQSSYPYITRSTPASVGTNIVSASADEKLHKILHKFQRVYPEGSAILKKYQNRWKYVTNSSDEGGHRNRLNQRLSEADVIINKANADISTNHTIRSKQVSRPIYRGEAHTNWNRECWIKSDAEYLILEF